MKNKTLIIVLIILLIASITLNIVLLSKSKTTASDNNNNDVIGIYHTNNYTEKNKQGAITLNKDNTCNYFDDNINSCTYTASDNNVSINSHNLPANSACMFFYK